MKLGFVGTGREKKVFDIFTESLDTVHRRITGA
jgi:hypothetical protein